MEAPSLLQGEFRLRKEEREWPGPFMGSLLIGLRIRIELYWGEIVWKGEGKGGEWIKEERIYVV